MTRKSRARIALGAVTTGVALTALSLTVHGLTNDEATRLPPNVAQGTSEPLTPRPAPITRTGDYYSVLGPAQRTHSPARTGTIEYCALDELQRPTCAYGELTSTQRRTAEAAGRQQLTIDPPGWGHNHTVTIAAAAGGRPYRGWFWNRSHLVADSLGGAAIAQNLVTGTRTQNVGSAQVDGQYAGGMAYTEGQARHYLDTRDGDTCPLYYAATPQYTGSELIPRTVLVDLQSCDRTIDERVEVANTAAGWAIDYTTGTFAAAANSDGHS